MKTQVDQRVGRMGLYGLVGLAIMLWAPGVSAADGKAEKSFTMAVTDQQGVETELKNGIFYWEEKMSETSFVPHELRHLPAKRGTATVNIKFDQIKQIEMKPGADKTAPAMTVTLIERQERGIYACRQRQLQGRIGFRPGRSADRVRIQGDVQVRAERIVSKGRVPWRMCSWRNRGNPSDR
jgi:hypothetical protein